MALNELDIFAAAIRRSESGSFAGSYGLTKPGTTGGQTLGAYQISETNWPDWADRAGLRSADWRNKGAQDAVAKFRMTELYNDYGDWRLVALSWFFGGETARRVQQTGLDDSGLEREMEVLEQNMRDAQARRIGRLPEGQRLSIEDPLVAQPGEDGFDFGPLTDATARVVEEPGEKKLTALLTAQAKQGEASPGVEARQAHNVNSKMSRNVGAILQGLSNAVKRGANSTSLPEGEEGVEQAARPLPEGEPGSRDEIVPGGVA